MFISSVRPSHGAQPKDRTGGPMARAACGGARRKTAVITVKNFVMASFLLAGPERFRSFAL